MVPPPSSWTPPPATMTLFRRTAGKLLKAPYLLYYRILFGRSLPGARWLSRWVTAYERTSGRGDVPLLRNVWDEQYREGGWDFLGRLDESPRYALIAAYFHHLCPGGRVLDVGCGEGLLAEALGPHGYSRYTGIDLSTEAIARAASRADERTTFLAVDAQTYAPEVPYDAIVFNECLYYFDAPMAVFDHYCDHVQAPAGVLILSLFRSPRTAAILRRLKGAHPLLEETRVANRRGEWVVAVFRPAPLVGPG
jgi:2-polyprenyl-3-methyl-5-hydroxy-6-metoxy-1,4-benzoquinol methylase